MRILCHCTDIYNNDACHFVLYILKSTTYTARCFSILKGFYFRSIFVVSHIDIHDITERLLKVALNTINQTNQAHWYSPYTHLYRSILKRFLKRVMYMINIHVNCGVYSEYAIDAYFSTK